jgi:hypothetical protein
VPETVPSGDITIFTARVHIQNSVVVVVVVVVIVVNSFSGNNTIFTVVSYTKLVV